MRGTFTQLLVLVFLIGCSVVLGSEKNQTTLFPLTDRAPVIQQIPANSSVTLQTKSAPTSQDAFWIFEVHTRERRVFFAHPNASSSASVKLGRESDFEPTHTGFTVFKSDLATNATFPTINVTNPNNVSLSAIFMVSSYDVSNAVPGGCTHFNQSALNSSTSRPDLKLTWGQNLVQVNFSLSGLLGAPDFTCNNSDLAGIKYSLYVRYLESRNYDENYLLTEMAETMLLPETIMEKGTLVADDFVQDPDLSMKKNAFFGAYFGIPSIYAVVAHHGPNQTSAYVSSATYACSLNPSSPMTCDVVTSNMSKVMSCVLMTCGLLLTFFGHRNYRFSHYVLSSMAGFFIAFVLVFNFTEFNYEIKLGITIVAGSAVAWAWMSVFVFRAVPVFNVVVPTLLVGFLFSGTVFFVPAMNLPVFISEVYFWSIFVSIMFVVATCILLLSFAKGANSTYASILSCVIVGSSSLIMACDNFLGGSLVYIVINVLRRAVVDNFNLAILMSPYQSVDALLTACLSIIVLIGLGFQLYRDKSTDPFPPTPRRVQRKPEDDQPANQQYINENQANEERQPLLGDAEDDQVVEIDPQMLLQVADSVHNAAETLSSAVEAMARSSQRGQQMSRSALRHAAEGMAAAARAVSPRPSAPPAMNFIKTCPPSAGRSVGSSAATSASRAPSVSQSNARSLGNVPVAREESSTQGRGVRDIFKPSTPEGETVRL